LRPIAATEAQKIGLAELARRIGADPSNLGKAINGEREFGLKLEQALRRFGGEGAEKTADDPRSRSPPSQSGAPLGPDDVLHHHIGCNDVRIQKWPYW